MILQAKLRTLKFSNIIGTSENGEACTIWHPYDTDRKVGLVTVGQIYPDNWEELKAISRHDYDYTFWREVRVYSGYKSSFGRNYQVNNNVASCMLFQTTQFLRLKFFLETNNL